jgi:hypothetical protein
MRHGSWAVWVASAGALLFSAGCNPPASEEEGFVVLDATARQAGLAVEVDGEAHAGPLPTLVPEGASVVIAGPERRQAIDVAPGELVSIHGPEGVVERGEPDRDRLRFRSAEGPARAFAERTGTRLVREEHGRFVLEGKDVLSIAGLFEEAHGIAGVEPFYAAPTAAGGRRATGAAEAPAPRSPEEIAAEDAALSALFAAEEAGLPTGDELRRARERIERDLELVMTMEGGRRVFVANQEIPVRVSVTNRAWTQHWLVKPDDGSEMGWREPYVFYTAQREVAPGVWQDVPRQSVSRCGNYDVQWDEDITALLPGASLSLDPRWLTPDRALDLEAAGKVRLYAHYQYSAGQERDGDFFGGSAVHVPRELEGVPPFELVSAPLEIEIQRPLDLALSTTGPLQPGEQTKMDEAFALSLSNRAGGAFPLPVREEDARVHFEIQGAGLRWGTGYNPAQIERGRGQDLAPGASVHVMAGPQSRADFSMPPGKATRSVQVRAVMFLWPFQDPRHREIKSNWVTATLE